MELMYKTLPKGSCPKCGHSEFVVSELVSSIYLTNRDGEIVDSAEDYYDCKGKCCNCGAEYDMFATAYSFIPATPLRKLLNDYKFLEPRIDGTIHFSENPMSK